MTAERGYLDLSVRQFLAALGASQAAPGGGSAAAAAVALGANLCAMTALLSALKLADRANAMVAAAEQWGARSASLIQADADSYRLVLQARPPADPASHRADAESGFQAALSAASDVPFEVAELGAAVAGLAEELAAEGNPSLRGDALTAAELAAAGARSAATLVAINLADQPDDDRPARAAALASAAARTAEQLRQSCH